MPNSILDSATGNPICGRCKQSWDPKFFNNDCSQTTGYSGYCRPCYSEIRNKHKVTFKCAECFLNREHVSENKLCFACNKKQDLRECLTCHELLSLSLDFYDRKYHCKKCTLINKAKNIIYGLVDPRNGECRYVGLSTKGLGRPESHRNLGKLKPPMTKKKSWIINLHKAGFDYEIVILYESPNDIGLKDAERFFIADYRARGFRLTNMTDGGDGRFKSPNSPEAIKKTADKNRGQKRGARDRKIVEKIAVSNRGKKRNEEIREAIGNRVRVMWEDPIKKAKWIISLTGRKTSDETKKKLSEITKKWAGTPENRARVAEYSKNRVWTEKSLLKLSESLRRWKDEDAYRLRAEGKTYRQIMAILGCAEKPAISAIKRHEKITGITLPRSLKKKASAVIGFYLLTGESTRYLNDRDAARVLNLSRGNIYACCKKSNYYHQTGGYTFRFAQEYDENEHTRTEVHSYLAQFIIK